MIEYIDKGAAKRAVDMALELDETEYKKVCAAIDNVAPAADVLPVVQCKDCKHHRVLFKRDMCAKNAVVLDNHEVGLRATIADDFCSYGER